MKKLHSAAITLPVDPCSGIFYKIGGENDCLSLCCMAVSCDFKLRSVFTNEIHLKKGLR